MIVLLSCSMNLSASDNQPYFPKGEPVDSMRKDSIKVAIDDLRKANAKLIELRYEKEINAKLRDVINKDSLIIEEYNSRVNKERSKARKYKRQCNATAFGGLSLFVALMLSLFR